MWNRIKFKKYSVTALILSTICFALSAAAYAIILSKQDVHKRCFIMFSSWMCLAFISLIVMQLQNDTQTCNGFGKCYTNMYIIYYIIITCKKEFQFILYGTSLLDFVIRSFYFQVFSSFLPWYFHFCGF